jgi:hypothetical protein
MPIMKYVTLGYLLLLLGFWFVQEGMGVLMMKGVPPENYPYIWFARFLLLGIGAVMILLVHIAWRKKHIIQQRIPA